MSSTPAESRALVVFGENTSAYVATVALAALEARGFIVEVVELGHVELEPSGLTQVFQNLRTEWHGRKLVREIGRVAPDTLVALDPEAAYLANQAILQEGLNNFVVVGLASVEHQARDWAENQIDRLFVPDAVWARHAMEIGLSAENMIWLGPLVDAEYTAVASMHVSDLRTQFKIGADEKVVLIHVEGWGTQRTAQMLLQLSLSSIDARFLFSAGQDIDAATVIREQVPKIGLRGKLFGRSNDEAKLWRICNVVCIPPELAMIHKAMAVGASLIVTTHNGETIGFEDWLVESGRGRWASDLLSMIGHLESVFAKQSAVVTDHASGFAESVWHLVEHKAKVIAERVKPAPPRREEPSTAPSEEIFDVPPAAEPLPRRPAKQAASDLEDLGGDDDFAAASKKNAGAQAGNFEESSEPKPGPAGGKVPTPNRAQVLAEWEENKKAAANAQALAQAWQDKADAARSSGQEALAREAQKSADRERLRMHSALHRMGELGNWVAGPSSAGRPTASKQRYVDDELSSLKKKVKTMPAEPAPQKKTPVRPPVDDELSALKRKMAEKPTQTTPPKNKK